MNLSVLKNDDSEARLARRVVVGLGMYRAARAADGVGGKSRNGKVKVLFQLNALLKLSQSSMPTQSIQ